MSLFQAFILGLLQGATEFLPVSSSGHLVIFQTIFGLTQDNLLFDVTLHLGTLLAVFIYFRNEVIELISGCIKIVVRVVSRKRKKLDQDEKLALLVIVGSIPTGIIGLILNNYTDTLFSSITLVGFMLLITAAVLYLSERYNTGDRVLRDMTASDAFVIGTFQGIAVMPGISRSGFTLSGSLFRGLKREWAFKFSFVLSIPAILGALLLEAKDAIGANLAIAPMAVGMATSFISGLIFLYVLNSVVKRGKLSYFSIYCLIVGLGAILYGYIF
ncbi:MAG: undecaprenyl-diphosphate phosphatase [Thermoanaerobacteraceae bacterium]|nr:undecaprenyl-diphosphate phosphatase [Thermoanaerobacteraceae bacterium]